VSETLRFTGKVENIFPDIEGSQAVPARPSGFYVMSRGNKFSGLFVALSRNFDTQDCWLFGLLPSSGILKNLLR
jgi:hypothetical protein